MPVPLKQNTAGQEDFVFIFDGSDIKTTPTIAAGDFQVSISGGAFNALATLPAESPAASGQVQIQFSQAETNGGVIAVRWIDQAGADWDDGAQTWRTDTSTLADLAATLATIAAGVVAIAAQLVAIAADIVVIDTNVDTILARIGAFTGAGVNTILGFLRAMSRNDLAAPSDMGGTYNPVLHSLQALKTALLRAECVGTVSADELIIVRGDSYDSDDDNAITDLGDISTYTKLWITGKHSKDAADTAAIFMIVLENPPVAATDGLQYLNGAESDALDPLSAISRAWGAITISDPVAGDIAFTLDEAATDDLVPSEIAYDIQWTDGTDVHTVRDDRVTITADVTRAIT